VRKFIVVAVVVALLLSVAGAAMASSSYWVVKFRTGKLTGTTLSNLGNVILGAQTTASSTNAATPASNAANVASAAGGGFHNAEWLDSDNPAPYVYTLTLAVGTAYPVETPVWVTAWAPEKYLGTAGRAMPTNYVVTVDGAGMAAPVTWTYANLYVGTVEPTTSGIGPVGFWYTPLGRNDAYGTSQDILTVTIGPAGEPPITPEPGSMVALGSGLVAMAGYALRRRRA